MKVVWSDEAKYSLLEIYSYIAKQSIQNAEKVLDTLLALGDSLSDEKVEYAKDPVLDDDKYRAVIKWSYNSLYKKR